MKRICFIISDISKCGGTEKVCLTIANELCRRGYDIHIISLLNRELPFFEFDNRITFHVLLGNAIEKKLKYKRWYKKYKIRHILQNLEIDTVVDTTLSDLVALSVAGSSIKYILWVNFSYDFAISYKPHCNAINHIKDKDCTLVTLTNKDREMYIQYSIRADKIRCINNPITFDIPPYAVRNSKTILSVGRFSQEKGFDMLLRAWSIIEKECPDWKLELWGNEDASDNPICQLKDELCLTNVHIKGRTNKIKDVFANAGIYVLPSRSEGFGLVLIEAAAMSLPLIAFDCPNGPKEIITQDFDGILVEANNIEKLAAAILKLIKNSNMRIEMGRNAYEMSHKYVIKNIGNRWSNIL